MGCHIFRFCVEVGIDFSFAWSSFMDMLIVEVNIGGRLKPKSNGVLFSICQGCKKKGVSDHVFALIESL